MKNNGSDWTKLLPYSRFNDFTAPAADRYAILLECIEALKLNSAVIPIEGNRHIFIFPSNQKSLRAAGGVFPFSGMSPYLFSAHYDRVEGSPGANDNSIAVFHLLSAAVKLANLTAKYPAQKKICKWLIIFTDKEELIQGESFEDQGAFSLAKKLKLWGLEKAKIYNFDACGAGDTFILSTTTDILLRDSESHNINNLREAILHLRDHALETANNLRLEKVLLAPTPFSDDIGFLRAGLSAQTVTILPANEAKQYEALIRSRPEFAQLIISGKVKEPHEYRRLPETWRSLNGPADTSSRLTPEHFEQFVNFVIKLAE